jgi:acetyl esterase/lipase
MSAPDQFVIVSFSMLTLLLYPPGEPSVLGQPAATPALPPRTWLPVDAFYDPPAEVPEESGVLLRSEPLTDRLLPEGAQAWRILYTTTFSDGAPAVAVATVLAPADPPPGPRPVIAWEHGTVGILQECMPSLVSAPFEGVPALDQVVAAGWVLVATDYAANEHGVHPYIIGDGEARSALDAVRATKQMPELSLDVRTVVWGHSQGGHAALWTGILGPRYAPDVEILGVAAIAPASNMERILTMHGGDSSGARLGAYIATAYSQFFPDVAFDEVVSPEARQIASEIATLCQFDPNDIPTLQAKTEQLGGIPVLANPTAGALGDRLRENAPESPITVPLLIAQGLTDVVIDPSVNDAYVEERCAAGQRLEYWRVPERDHGGIVAPDSPLGEPLMRWTRERFAGESQPAGCQEATI